MCEALSSTTDVVIIDVVGVVSSHGSSRLSSVPFQTDAVVPSLASLKYGAIATDVVGIRGVERSSGYEDETLFCRPPCSLSSGTYISGVAWRHIGEVSLRHRNYMAEMASGIVPHRSEESTSLIVAVVLLDGAPMSSAGVNRTQRFADVVVALLSP